MENFPVLCLFLFLSFSLACAEEENRLTMNAEPPLANGLSWTVSKSTCSELESIIEERIKFDLKDDITEAAAFLCLHFHDCFAQGCDASVLLDGSANGQSEQDGSPNLTKAFEIIIAVKERVDEACGVTVSCADIIALVARDPVTEISVWMTDRFFFKGRRLQQQAGTLKKQPPKPSLYRGHDPQHN